MRSHEDQCSRLLARTRVVRRVKAWCFLNNIPRLPAKAISGTRVANKCARKQTDVSILRRSAGLHHPQKSAVPQLVVGQLWFLSKRKAHCSCCHGWCLSLRGAVSVFIGCGVGHVDAPFLCRKRHPCPVDAALYCAYLDSTCCTCAYVIPSS